MAVTYQQLLHSVALRMSALIGAQFTQAETTYSSVLLGSSSFKSTDWPFSSFRDSILMAEEQFAEVAASSVDEHGVGNHVWRSSMAGVTSLMTSGSLIPSTDSGGTNRIIGAYGEVIDGTDGSILTKRPLDEVRRLIAETWRKYPMYFYNTTGRRIFHTRTTVLMGVCVYNRATQVAAYNSNTSMLLPDTAEPGIVSLAVSLMTKDGAFHDQSVVYHGYATEALAIVGRGGVPSAAAAST